MKRILALALLACPAFGQYSYYLTDGFNPWINGPAWQANGTWSGGNGLVRSTTTAGASLISKVAVPDGSASYAVRTLVRLAVAGGTYVHYLRASQDAMTGPQAAGTFYSVAWSNRVLGNGCQMTMTVNQRVSGVFTQRASVIVGCQKSLNNALESVVTADGRLMVYVNGALVYGATGDNVILSGAPGVGVMAAPVEHGLVLAQLGPLDRTAPAAVERARIASSAMPNSVDLQWQDADDGANGTGVPQYLVYRNLVLVAGVHGNFYSDQTAQPGQTYTYLLTPVDRHNNYGPDTSFTVTTPAVAGEARRVGVRSNGAYWGGAGEQIDVMSGNLNFSVPLLAASRRDGWKLALGLSYNSQNWRRDGTAAEWNLGRDIGYGYGWMLMAGQIRPHYSDTWTVHHWTFVDATGAEYRLDQLNGGKWRSKEGTYVRWDAEAQRLWWPDGSFWSFYCVSGAGEADRGTYYPTVFQDRNGNVTAIEYHGGWASGLPDTSGRIGHIVDVRAPGNWSKAYQFYYTWSAKPHLERITSLVGTGENYVFTYSAEGALQSPFTGAAFGTATTLSVVKNETAGLQHTFSYGTNASGELVKAVLPKGAELEWAYGPVQYGNGKSFREVTTRWLRAATGAGQWAYTVQGSGGSANSCVQTRTVTDASGPDKVWTFEQNPGLANYGLVTAYEERRQAPTMLVLARQESTWALDSRGRPYVGTAVTKLDPGTANEKVSKVETVLDDLGNMTERRVYDYGNLTTPVRTYRNFYTDIAGGRLATKSEVVEGAQTLVLGEWKYDGAGGALCVDFGGWLTDAPGMPYHDEAYGLSNITRGLVTWSKALGQPAGCVRYDIGGNVVKSGVMGGGTQEFTVTSASQWTAPSAVTPNGESHLASSYQWDSYLKLTSASGPNGAAASFSYDSMSRPASTTSPHGAVTTFAYTQTATTATTNGKWVKTTTDGLGRSVKVESGYGTTTVWVVETEYGVCACTPLGKVKRVSMPYAPGAAVYWTEYEYDARGRTLKVTPPGNAGFTSYVYEGNAVKVIEPVTSKWKKFTLDALGRLVKVTEPRPGVTGATDDTLYSYNALDKLAQVSMTRGSTTQIRSFVFDSEMRLSSVTQPENGTTSYTYDGLSRVASRTDAKGQRAEYSYDNYNRVTMVKRFVGGVEDVGQRTVMRYDTAENGWGRVASVAASGSEEGYGYTAGGLVKKKWVQVGGAQKPLVAEWTYDNEGRRTSVKYPDLYYWAQDPNQAEVSEVGKKVNWQYDAAGRWTGVQDALSLQMMASNATYNAAGQLTGVTLQYGSDQYTYNARGQLTREQHPAGVDISYGYSATANDGRLVSKTDGTTVEYQYDELGRLISAATAGTGGWGLGWVYDGFGNRLQQNVTKGTAPVQTMTVNAGTNRISSSGFGYDANGNMTQWPAGGGTAAGTFDVENRMVGVVSGTVTESYGYNAANQRVWVQRGTDTARVYFYGLEGELLGVYNHLGDRFNLVETRAYFQGRRLREGWSDDVEDRMGSVRWQQRWQETRWFNYYPYGEQMGGSSNEDQRKFGTYWRDSASGLDYAWNRYYSATWGRFGSADPALSSNALLLPQNWNRYSYVSGDPVNKTDPQGLCSPQDTPVPCYPIDATGKASPTPGGGGGGGGSQDMQTVNDGIADSLSKPALGEANQWMPTVNPATNNRIRPILLNRMTTFSGSNCDKIFKKALTNYTTGGYESMAISVNFYFASTTSGAIAGDSNLTQHQVSGNDSATTLRGTLPLGSDAVTIINGIVPAIIMSEGIVGRPGFSNILLHELLHAYTGMSDQALFGQFQAHGLVSPGDGTTAAISKWIGTDCNYTPK